MLEFKIKNLYFTISIQIYISNSMIQNINIDFKFYDPKYKFWFVLWMVEYKFCILNFKILYFEF